MYILQNLLLVITFKIYFQVCDIVLTRVSRAVYYIPMDYLFCNWKFAPFDSLHPFHSPSTPPPLATTSPLWFIVSLVYLFFSLDSTFK